jgi:hypothetical protein
MKASITNQKATKSGKRSQSEHLDQIDLKTAYMAIIKANVRNYSLKTKAQAR